MGDFKKTTKTKIDMRDAVEERESRARASTKTVKAFIEGSKIKDKMISAKVYPETWATFTAINKAQGMTNNSVINMLISQYIRENKEILQ